MAREEGKALGIEKFDRLWVLKDADRKKIISTIRNCVYLFWGRNLILWKMKNGIFLIDRYYELFD